jgi:SHS2 domain-containing protein
MATPNWELFAHGADIGVRGYGNTREEAFAHAATAMTAVITDPQMVEPTTEVEIRCEAPDDELLLVDWLNALVYEMATRAMLFGRFLVRIEDGKLRAKAWGENVDRKKHQPAVEVKGATYTNLRVARDATGMWVAECVVDV